MYNVPPSHPSGENIFVHFWIEATLGNTGTMDDVIPTPFPRENVFIHFWIEATLGNIRLLGNVQ